MTIFLFKNIYLFILKITVLGGIVLYYPSTEMGKVGGLLKVPSSAWATL